MSNPKLSVGRIAGASGKPLSDSESGGINSLYTITGAPDGTLPRPLISFEKYLEIRSDSSTPGRVVWGYALPGTAQTTAEWLIYAEDSVGNYFHRQFAEDGGTPTADFVHKWSDRLTILPDMAFLAGFSYQFTGNANSYGSVAHSADISFANNAAFSIEVHFKTNQSSSAVVFQKTSSAAGNNGYQLVKDGSGRLEFSFRGAGAGDRIRVRTDSFTDANDGSWHQVIITKASGSTAASSVKIYVDGNEETLNVLNDTLSGTTTNTDILALAANLSGNSRFTANIKRLAIWNVELTTAEVAEIWNNNAGVINLKSGSGQISSSLISWWRMGDGTFVAVPAIPDEQGSNDMTLQESISGNIETEVPP